MSVCIQTKWLWVRITLQSLNSYRLFGIAVNLEQVSQGFRNKRFEKFFTSIRFTKSNSLPWVFSRFLNCTSGTKSYKASYLIEVSARRVAHWDTASRHDQKVPGSNPTDALVRALRSNLVTRLSRTLGSN